MKYRDFGSTGLSISVLSFGAMRATGDAAHVARAAPPTQEQIDRQNASGRAALELALDSGVNCIHSSEDYGTWWMIGDVLRHRPDRTDVHHVIKVTTPDYDEEHFDPSRVRDDVEAALRALHAERISVVQHLQRGPHVSKDDAYATSGDGRRIGALSPIADGFGEVIESLRDEGKVAAGITFPHTMGYADAALDSGRYAGIAHFFNLIETEALPLLDRMEREGFGYFAIRPLLQGMLTDKRVSRDVLPRDDPKARRGWDTRYALLARIREELGDPPSWTEFALRFALAHPAVTSLITSAGTPQQMTAMLAAVESDLPERSVLDRVHALGVAAGDLPKSDLYLENLLAD